MATLSMEEELVFIVLQFLRDEGYTETLHMLERQSGIFFDMKYFEEILTQGMWEEAKDYLFGFTYLDENRYSYKLYFEIQKQKYFEALDKNDKSKAIEILRDELRLFSTDNERVFKDLTLLLTLDNIREYEGLSSYGDTKTSREILCTNAKLLIEANPVFCNKLEFPIIENKRLQTLVMQSFNVPGTSCTNELANPYIGALYEDLGDQDAADRHDSVRARQEESAKEKQPSDGTEQRQETYVRRI